MQPSEDSLFLGIDHIGVAVQDLASATTTYRDVLGFDVEGGETLPDRGLDVTFVLVGTGRIELIAPTREDSEVSGFLRKRGEGIHHICVRVRSMDEALKSLKTRGAQLVGEGARPGAHGRKVAFVHPKGAHGVLMELVEVAAEANP